MEFSDTVKECCLQGGRIAMEGFYRKKEVRRKDADQLVSEYDVLTEQKIIGMIREKYPDHSIYGEESGMSHKDSEYLWLIDPIDGTHNYVNAIPIFGVSVAVAQKGRVVCGAINMPMQNELFYADLGGAFLNGNIIECSSKKKIEESMLLFGTNFQRIEAARELFPQVARQCLFSRALGCAVANLAYTACARADIMIDFELKPYDMAAGCFIAQKAGCAVTDHHGREWSLQTKDIAVANKRLHSKVIDIICRQ